MNLQNDYSLVLTNLIEELDKDRYKNNSLPLKRLTSSTYSSSSPSIQVQISETAPLVIYDIEVGDSITEVIISKWKDHAKKCQYIYLIVPEELKRVAEFACAKEFNNYIVIPYRFIKTGNNRNVIIQFP